MVGLTFLLLWKKSWNRSRSLIQSPHPCKQRKDAAPQVSKSLRLAFAHPNNLHALQSVTHPAKGSIHRMCVPISSDRLSVIRHIGRKAQEKTVRKLLPRATILAVVAIAATGMVWAQNDPRIGTGRSMCRIEIYSRTSSCKGNPERTRPRPYRECERRKRLICTELASSLRYEQGERQGYPMTGWRPLMLSR